MLGFSLVFVSLGAVASSVGIIIVRSLPWIQRLGGVAIILFGAQLLGILQLAPLMRERRVHLTSGVTGNVGAFVVGTLRPSQRRQCVTEKTP